MLIQQNNYRKMHKRVRDEFNDRGAFETQRRNASSVSAPPEHKFMQTPHGLTDHPQVIQSAIGRTGDLMYIFVYIHLKQTK